MSSFFITVNIQLKDKKQNRSSEGALDHICNVIQKYSDYDVPCYCGITDIPYVNNESMYPIFEETLMEHTEGLKR